jgi:hypothetical protein
MATGGAWRGRSGQGLPSWVIFHPPILKLIILTLNHANEPPLHDQQAFDGLSSGIHCTPLYAVGVSRGADMSLTGFHPLWDKILSQNLHAVADQGGHLEGSSPNKGTADRGVYCRIF